MLQEESTHEKADIPGRVFSGGHGDLCSTRETCTQCGPCVPACAALRRAAPCAQNTVSSTKKSEGTQASRVLGLP